MNRGDIFAGLQIQTAPSSEPLTTSEVATALRLPTSDTDTNSQLSAWITTVRKLVEGVMRRPMLQQQWKLSLRNWPGRSYQNWPLSLTSAIDLYYTYNYISLPFAAPLVTVDSVTYLTSSGVTKTMSNANKSATYTSPAYNVWTEFEPGRIILPYAGIWPTDVLMPGAPIAITYTVGYADLTHLQAWEGWEVARQAMLLLISDCWENRLPPDKAQRSGKMSVIEEWLTPNRIFE